MGIVLWWCFASDKNSKWFRHSKQILDFGLSFTGQTASLETLLHKKNNPSDNLFFTQPNGVTTVSSDNHNKKSLQHHCITNITSAHHRYNISASSPLMTMMILACNADSENKDIKFTISTFWEKRLKIQRLKWNISGSSSYICQSVVVEYICWDDVSWGFIPK